MKNELIHAANDMGAFVLPMHGQVPAADGLLCAANESLFNQAYYSEPLTQYVVGWEDPTNLEELLGFLAPEVPCGRRFEYKKGINSESFLSESDDVRAINADFKKVDFSGETAQGITLNKGLTLFVDLDRVADEPNWENRRAAWLWNRLTRNEVRRAVNGLSQGATGVTKTWNTSADPDVDMAEQVDLGGDAVGFEPNRGFCGKSAWLKRFRSFRAQNNAGAYASSTMTPEQVAAQLGLDKFMVAKSRYQSSSSAKSKIVGDVVIFFYAEDGQISEDPSNIKRFVSNTTEGGRMRVFRQEVSSKIVSITVEHYSKIIVVQSAGLRKITVQ